MRPGGSTGRALIGTHRFHAQRTDQMRSQEEKKLGFGEPSAVCAAVSKLNG